MKFILFKNKMKQNYAVGKNKCLALTFHIKYCLVKTAQYEING